MRAAQTRSYMGHGSPGLRCQRTSEKSLPLSMKHLDCNAQSPGFNTGFSFDRHLVCSMPKESMPARQAKQLVLDMCQINANPRQGT